MRRPIIILFSVLMMLACCKGKPQASESNEPLRGEETAHTKSDTNKPMIEQKDEPVQNGRAAVKMISIEKTACYGTCPIYKAAIWSDQRLVWEGERFVELVGYEEYIVPQKLIADIMDYSEVVGFSSFDTLYDTDFTDLPTTTVMILANGSGRKKTVKLHGEAPKDLEKFMEYVHKRITGFVYAQ